MHLMQQLYCLKSTMRSNEVYLQKGLSFEHIPKPRVQQAMYQSLVETDI